MKAVFDCKQISEGGPGSTSDEFLINKEFIAMLDYYVVTSLSANSSKAESFRAFYCDLQTRCDHCFRRPTSQKN